MLCFYFLNIQSLYNLCDDEDYKVLRQIIEEIEVYQLGY